MALIIKIRSNTEVVTLRRRFNVAKDTVYSVKQAYCDEHNNNKAPDKLILRKKGKKLQNDHYTLLQYQVKRTLKILMLSMSSKLIGGALYVSNKNILNNDRKRRLNKSDPEIKVSNKPDCVYWDKSEDRAEMPCGHAFTPTSMFNTLKSVMTKNEYEYEIKCPACGSELDFDICAKIADLNENEYVYFLEEIEKRSSPESKPCPNCNMDCERPESLKKFRVNCTSCNGGDWCFLCGGEWQASGFTVCGSKNCEGYEINDILAGCDLKKTTYGSGGKMVEVPEMRACPNCLDFIEHEDKCKHMTCEKCGHKFCFSCLKPQLNGSWQCGSVESQCVIAPRQKF